MQMCRPSTLISGPQTSALGSEHGLAFNRLQQPSVEEALPHSSLSTVSLLRSVSCVGCSFLEAAPGRPH